MTELTRQEGSFRQTRRAFVEAVPIAVAALVRCAHAPIGEVYRAAIPMILVLLCGVLLITYVPQLTTFLPHAFAR